MLEDLRTYLKMRRRAVGLSQSQLARNMNSEQPYICELEKGKRQKPSLLVLVKWAAALNLDFEIRLIPRDGSSVRTFRIEATDD